MKGFALLALVLLLLPLRADAQQLPPLPIAGGDLGSGRFVDFLTVTDAQRTFIEQNAPLRRTLRLVGEYRVAAKRGYILWINRRGGDGGTGDCRVPGTTCAVIQGDDHERGLVLLPRAGD